MLPDIDSLALFVRAAEMRSLTKAADASHIGLAAASRRITLLEHRLKTALLERSSKGVELTAAGKSLLPHAKALLLQMNQMQADMADHAAGRKGSLRILANTSAMAEFLPGDLAQFARANPDVGLNVEERWSAEIARAIRANEADLGIVIEGLDMEGLQTFPYRSDRLAVIMVAGHPLAGVAGLRYTDVLAFDVVGLESGSSMMRLLADQASSAEQVLKLRGQVRSFEAVGRMVQAGLGLGILPLQAATALSQGMGLVVKPLPEDWAVRTMQICINKNHADHTGNLALDALLRYLRSRVNA